MSANAGTMMCQFCGLKPVFGGYNYCSKTCGKSAAGGGGGTAGKFLAAAGGPYQGNTSSARSGLCKNCGVKPVYGTSDYCGRTCRDQAKTNPPASRSPPAYTATRSRSFGDDDDDDDDDDNLDGYDDDDDDDNQFPSISRHVPSLKKKQLAGKCINCNQYDKVPPFDFCSKQCREDAARKLTGGPSSSRGGGIFGFGNGKSSTPKKPQRPPGNPCVILGCKNFEHKPGYKYCSDKCRKEAVKKGLEPACLLCKEYPKTPGKHFCGKKCGQKAESSAPLLLDVPATDPKYIDITNQFNNSWQGGNAPKIHRICKVVNPKKTEDNFQKYRNQVEAAGGFVGQGKPAGNENRRWHGTLRSCTVGDTASNLAPCGQSGCPMCSIINSSFDMAFCRRGAYGWGIYTSAYSSVSHGYTSTSSGSPYKAMFLTRIIAGKESTYSSTAAGTPPPGFDSVVVAPKHTMLIVAKNEAICPSWLVIYN